MKWYARSESWSFILRSYLPRLALCSLAWEVVQLPLYALWTEPRWERVAFAVAHCTVGDAMIGTSALVLALILRRVGRPANWHRTKVGMLSTVLAVAYTVLSERINLSSGSWSYSAWMPVLPWVEVGLAPVAQWIIVPSVVWWWANRQYVQSRQLR